MVLWKTTARTIVIAAFLCIICGPLFAAEGGALVAGTNSPVAGVPPILSFDVRCFGGNPPLLEFTIRDPDKWVREIVIDSGLSRFSWNLTGERDGEIIELKAQPFFNSGAKTVSIGFHGEEYSVYRDLRVVVTDFTWGRDNFNFANDDDYESFLGTYSDILFSWLDERFGALLDAEKIPLVHYMYSLFGETTGRCYAFSGSALKYFRNPELLKPYFDTAFSIRERSVLYQKQMNFLQIDMVFEHFVAGAYSVEGPQSRNNLVTEIGKIKGRIDEGVPAAAGFMGKDFHHSMLVYGYLEDKLEGKISLLAANNWNRDQGVDLHANDAENIRINFSLEGGAPPVIEWISRNGGREDVPERLFLVEAGETYVHDKAILRDFIERQFGEYLRGERALLVVDNAGEVWLETPDKNRTGYIKERLIRENTDIRYRRVKTNHLFDFAPGTGLNLFFADSGNVGLFYMNRKEGAEETFKYIDKTGERDEEKARSAALSPDSFVFQEIE